MTGVRQAVVLAGGRGERLRPLTDDVPKPLVEVAGRPFAFHVLDDLAREGISEVLFLTGYLGEAFPQVLGDSYAQMTLSYHHGPEEWSTGERLLRAETLLHDDFLLLYGDNLVSFSVARLCTLSGHADASLCLTLGRKSPGNVVVGEASRVSRYLACQRSAEATWVELGYMLANRDVLLQTIRDVSGSLPNAISLLADRGRIVADQVLAPYFSISDPERLAIASEAIRNSRVILIDRDGVINVKAPKAEYIKSVDQFHLISENVQAMKELSTEGFSFIIISNQAGIARGVVTAEEVATVNRHMVDELARRGIRVLDVYVCPHHWDDDCECRKPKPGMLLQAARDHHLRMERVVFVGDDPRDAQAATAAGCQPVLVGFEQGSMPGVRSQASLLDAVEHVRGIYISPKTEGR